MLFDEADGREKVYDDPTLIHPAIEGNFSVQGADCQPVFSMIKEHLKQYEPEWASQVSTVPAETVKRLARECRNIIGIKEAGGSADRVSQLRAALGPRFEILSGDDAITLPFMAVGAQGVISVASNVIPRQVAQMVRAFAAGKAQAALKLHQQCYPLFKDLFIETNPVPVKAALAMLGQIEEEYRLPLVPLSAKNRETLRASMKAVGILK